MSEALEAAKKLIEDIRAGDQRKEDMIAELRKDREAIDAALLALGVDQKPARKRTPGRPKGSRNRAKVEVLAC
jgi:hypothetical protein